MSAKANMSGRRKAKPQQRLTGLNGCRLFGLTPSEAAGASAAARRQYAPQSGKKSTGQLSKARSQFGTVAGLDRLRKATLSLRGTWETTIDQLGQAAVRSEALAFPAEL